MATRRVLKGITHDIVKAFVSRNNDIDGYWAIGKFCRHAAISGVNSLAINMLGSPNLPREFHGTVNFHRDLLRRSAKSRSIRMQSAVVMLKFNKLGLPQQGGTAQQTYGFEVSLALAEESGKHWTFIEHGRCWEHDPVRELRSNRRRKRVWRVLIDRVWRSAFRQPGEG